MHDRSIDQMSGPTIHAMSMTRFQSSREPLFAYYNMMPSKETPFRSSIEGYAGKKVKKDWVSPRNSMSSVNDQDESMGWV
jgi:hypothetical protein